MKPTLSNASRRQEREALLAKVGECSYAELCLLFPRYTESTIKSYISFYGKKIGKRSYAEANCKSPYMQLVILAAHKKHPALSVTQLALVARVSEPYVRGALSKARELGLI